MAANTFGVLALVVTRIHTIRIDVTPNQNHRFPSHITENPVDDGSVYSDHQILLPAILELDCRVSDSSVSLVDTFTGKKSAQESFSALLKLQKDRIPFDVHTGLLVYVNMLMEEISVPRTAKDGKSIRFLATMREVAIIGRDTITNRDRVALNVSHTAVQVRDIGIVSKSL